MIQYTAHTACTSMNLKCAYYLCDASCHGEKSYSLQGCDHKVTLG